MTITTRVARLFRADIHALLDRLEEPDVLLSGAIREMEVLHAERQHAATELARKLERLGSNAEERRQEIARLSDELEVCLAEDNDELARSVIRRRLRSEANLRLIVAQHSTLGDEHSQLLEDLSREAMALQEVREKQQLLKSEPEPLEPSVEIGSDEVEVYLLQAKRARNNAEGAT